jgi:molybdenum cofactor biosynthesis enzyme MoaA
MIDELMIRVTYRCNQNCEFCFNNIFDDKVDYKTKEKLDIGVIQKFVKDNGVKIIYISGGEPTVYENIKDFTYEMSKLGKVFYFTNGLLLDKFKDEEISDMGISAINISVYTNEIQKETNTFVRKCDRLSKLKEKYPNIKINAQVMIDESFFDVINSKGFKKMEKIFDRINWQPLAIPKGHRLYKTTLEGMDRNKAKRICEYLEKTGTEKKANTLLKILDKEIDEPCLMGIKYITLNPDMTINICPHKNDTKLTIDEFNKIKGKINNSNENCLSMRCVSLQSFLNKKYLQEKNN